MSAALIIVVLHSSPADAPINSFDRLMLAENQLAKICIVTSLGRLLFLVNGCHSWWAYHARAMRVNLAELCTSLLGRMQF